MSLPSLQALTLNRMGETWLTRIEPSQQVGRSLEADGIKAISIVMVVFIHAAGICLVQDTTMGLQWWLSMVLNGICRTCVPWFVIVSGFLLLRQESNTPPLTFYRKRLARLLSPFVFWMFVYIIWRRVVYADSTSWHHYLVEIFQGPVYYHLWFIYMIVGLYLATPFMRTLLRHAEDRDLTVFLAIWFCGASALPLLEKLAGFRSPVPLGVFASYFGFFVFGGCLHRFRLNATRLNLVASIWVVVTILGIVGTWWLSKRDDGRVNAFLLQYLSPNIVISSVCGYLVLREWDWNYILLKTGIWGRGILLLGKVSFGVYLAHVLVLELLARHVIPPNSDGGWFVPVVLGIATLLLTTLLVTVGRQVSWLSRVLP